MLPSSHTPTGQFIFPLRPMVAHVAHSVEITQKRRRDVAGADQKANASYPKLPCRAVAIGLLLQFLPSDALTVVFERRVEVPVVVLLGFI